MFTSFFAQRTLASCPRSFGSIRTHRVPTLRGRGYYFGGGIIFTTCTFAVGWGVVAPAGEQGSHVRFTRLDDKLHRFNCAAVRGSRDQSLLKLRDGNDATWLPQSSSSGRFPDPRSHTKTFVITFNGGSEQLQVLRESVTAVVTNASSSTGDQVVVVLTSPGGGLEEYGLATAQMERIRDAELPLTVCVDEIAASGGYMMASVADHIVATNFSTIGSIGVVSEHVNIHSLLEKIGVRLDTITAGEDKRALSLGKAVTEHDLAHEKRKLEIIHNQFKNHVLRHRPLVDIDLVSTGDSWRGADALRLGLVDEIGVSDDVLLSIHNGVRGRPVRKTMNGSRGRQQRSSVMENSTTCSRNASKCNQKAAFEKFTAVGNDLMVDPTNDVLTGTSMDNEKSSPVVHHEGVPSSSAAAVDYRKVEHGPSDVIFVRYFSQGEDAALGAVLAAADDRRCTVLFEK